MSQPRKWTDNASRQAAYRARKRRDVAEAAVVQAGAVAQDAAQACRVLRDALQAGFLTLATQRSPHAYLLAERLECASMEELLLAARSTLDTLNRAQHAISYYEHEARDADERLRGMLT